MLGKMPPALHRSEHCLSRPWQVTVHFTLAALLALLTLAAAINSGCKSKHVSLLEHPPSQQPEEANQTVVTIQSTLTQEASSMWQWRQLSRPTREKLTRLQVVSSDFAWVAADDGVFYRTGNSGDSWARIEPGQLREVSVTDLWFLNDSAGWIAFTNALPPLQCEITKAASLTIASARGAAHGPGSISLGRMQFASNNEGWALGTKYREGGFAQTPYLLHLPVGGSAWEDQSVDLARAWPLSDQSLFASDIAALKPAEAAVLSTDGRVIVTSDGGRRWRQRGKLNEGFEFLTFLALRSSPSGNLWGVGGGDGPEGVWFFVRYLEGDNSWRRHGLPDIAIRDALLLSDSELLVCGSRDIYGTAGRRLTKERTGVILWSRDRGEHWQIVYETTQVSSINALAFKDTIWAVGNSGLVLSSRLHRRAGSKSGSSLFGPDPSRPWQEVTVHPKSSQRVQAFAAPSIASLDPNSIRRVL
jgi:photosystem II stability/assembly factor-like uncharacterized protein